MSLRHLLLAGLNMVPPSKGRIFKRPTMIFTEQAVKGRLELRGHKLLTGTKIFFKFIVRIK